MSGGVMSGVRASPVLIADMRIADNIAYPNTPSGAHGPTTLATDLIAAFEIEHLLRRFPSQLSRGQRQASSLVVAASHPVEMMMFESRVERDVSVTQGR
jgi:ABC-type sulfate/molybdate transport systems ATPase subunit